MTGHLHHAPSACPVCGERLVTSRLGCQQCGTELVGSFAPCPFCALDADDHDLLRVFLTSRGNLKELEKHLGVSYPTARSRFNAVLQRLGWAADAGEGADTPEEPGAGPDETGDAASAPGRAAPAASAPGGAAPAASVGPATPDAVRDQVLAQVASGALSPDAAADLLGRLR